MKIKFSDFASKQVEKLEPPVRRRIGVKLKWFAEQECPLDFAEPLSDSRIGKYRYRIGSYRVIFEAIENCIFVIRVGHRREIYKKI